MKNFFAIFFFLAFFFTCASKNQISIQALTPQTGTGTLLPVEQSMATFIGMGLEGDSRTFSDTHYGITTVTIGRSYLLALKLPCREGYVQGSQRTRIASCKGQKVGWILAPNILGNGAL